MVDYYKRFQAKRAAKHNNVVVAEKGTKGGKCNVTACQRQGAHFFNKSTMKYYCEDCAREINWEGGRKDTMELYGVPLLCEYEA